jgi:high-affinity K+ transport system ATPase subunit B
MASGSALLKRMRAALEEALSLVTPLELSLVLSTLALVFLVAANNHGQLM